MELQVVEPIVLHDLLTHTCPALLQSLQDAPPVPQAVFEVPDVQVLPFQHPDVQVWGV